MERLDKITVSPRTEIVLNVLNLQRNRQQKKYNNQVTSFKKLLSPAISGTFYAKNLKEKKRHLQPSSFSPFCFISACNMTRKERLCFCR
jgi:hypothetical protein